MKKILLTSVVTLLSFATISAQEGDKMLFNHYSVGVTVGTTGWGVDVATTCTPYLQIRGGITVCPRFKVNTDLDLEIGDYNRYLDQIKQYSQASAIKIPDKIDVQGKVGFTNGKILVDFFPFKSTGFPFFITAGAYFGTSSIASIYNREEGGLSFVNNANAAIDEYNRFINNNEAVAQKANLSPINNVYAELGDYRLGPDQNGNIKAEIKVNGFKPYVGIGFGRTKKKKNRVGFVFELGCQFWGSPKVYCNGMELKSENAGSKAGDILKTISKISVYPVLSFRLCGRIL